MARIRTLLDYIVMNYAVQDEQLDVDLNASAVEDGAEIESEKREVAQREIDRANELADAFAQGLVAAYRAQAAGGGELVLDDRDPDENQMADALIGFLVSYGLATSQSKEIAPLHYSYTVAVDWDRLRRVAEAAEVDLDHELGAA